jgi:hypothetical protein
MTAGQFILGTLRLGAILAPAVLTAHWLRSAWLGVVGAVAALAEAILTLSLILVTAELLGLLSLDHPGELFAVLVALAATTWRALRPTGERRPATRPESRRPALHALVAVAVVVAQWCVQTANALGGGMLNFDTLWYHMPFAARFAQSGSVTGIQFTQADPFVAYYPANSELFHAIGLGALHSDFVSPFLNLLWLAIALLAAWCAGRRWRVESGTLTAGCLLMSLPVLSATQPGEAFNDVVGLAALLAAVALALEVSDGGPHGLLAIAGLGLGLAIGTKLTFLVPAVVLVTGISWAAPPSRRARAAGLLTGMLVLTAGWWYLRDLLAVGNPVGLRMHLGPLTLPGPSSALANASQQTVFSELQHFSLWGSRFAPGLAHALGPLWPLVLGLYLVGTVGGILVGDRTVRTIAVAAALAGLSYLFFPTGATGIEQGTTLFVVNVRYATPALALGLVLIPIVVRERAPRVLTWTGPALAILLLATQFAHELWPTQPARHLVFLLGVVLAAGVFWQGRALRHRPAPVLAVITIAATVLAGGVAYAVQRHYTNRRYLIANRGDSGLSAIYRWAQSVAHSRIALYGTVEQYPLYGADDTNRVDYLGIETGDGGYQPLPSCSAWRSTLNRGRYRYVVLTVGGPTRALPAAWTQRDRAAAVLLNPAPGDYVFRVTGDFQPSMCP